MAVNTYLTGNTIRIQATFTDFYSVLTDPEVIKLIIYDSKQTKLTEYTLTSANKISTGVYYYDYTIPSSATNNMYFYEFYGEIGGKPSLNREQFKALFI